MEEIKVIIRKIDKYFIQYHFEALVASLYESRKKEVVNFKRDEPKFSSITAGRLLQDVISRELGLTTDEINILDGLNGKPFLENNPRFRFNLSHSGEYVALAYGHINVGVDIEQIRTDNQKIAGRCFTENEQKYVDGDDERFTELWTMKESYLKYTGDGITVPLNSFEIDAPNKRVVDTTATYQTYKFDNYVLSVCAEGDFKVNIVREDEWVTCIIKDE